MSEFKELMEATKGSARDMTSHLTSFGGGSMRKGIERIANEQRRAGMLKGISIASTLFLACGLIAGEIKKKQHQKDVDQAYDRGRNDGLKQVTITIETENEGSEEYEYLQAGKTE